MEALIIELKQKIIDVLNLEGIKPEDISDDTPLFNNYNGLGLDSIDTLELLVLLEKNYGIKLTNPTEAKAILKDVRSIADYVAQHRSK